MVMCPLLFRCLSQQKDVEEEKGSLTVRIAYLSLVVSLCFILEFLLGYRKDNFVILVISSLSLTRTSSSLLKINTKIILLRNKG